MGGYPTAGAGLYHQPMTVAGNRTLTAIDNLLPYNVPDIIVDIVHNIVVDVLSALDSAVLVFLDLLMAFLQVGLSQSQYLHFEVVLPWHYTFHWDAVLQSKQLKPELSAVIYGVTGKNHS